MDLNSFLFLVHFTLIISKQKLGSCDRIWKTHFSESGESLGGQSGWNILGEKKKQRLKNSTLGNTFYEVGQNDSENKMREKVLGF